MEKEIIVYYRKEHKIKWFVALALLSVFYLLIFLFNNVNIFFGFHFLFLFYLILRVISLKKPYLKIKNNTLSSSNYMFKSLKLEELNEVYIFNNNFVFNENVKYLFIDLDLITEEDRKRIMTFLKERKLLEHDDTSRKDVLNLVDKL